MNLPLYALGAGLSASWNKWARNPHSTAMRNRNIDNISQGTTGFPFMRNVRERLRSGRRGSQVLHGSGGRGSQVLRGSGGRGSQVLLGSGRGGPHSFGHRTYT